MNTFYGEMGMIYVTFGVIYFFCDNVKKRLCFTYATL